MNNMSLFRHDIPKPRLEPEDYLEKTFSDYLSCHPTYMIPLIRAHNFIMRDLGPLSTMARHYIALLAASRHRCSYLVSISKKEFLHNGGDPDWLRNYEKAPLKLRSLQTVNKILAHQPWLLKKSHIESLVKGPYQWSLSELTHAIIIMVHFHALCSLSFGCKFGSDKPENFENEDNDCEEVEIEELVYDVKGSQKIKKIVKRSPASKLIIERCRQLELENATLAEIMTTRFNERNARWLRQQQQQQQRQTKWRQEDPYQEQEQGQKEPESEPEQQPIDQQQQQQHQQQSADPTFGYIDFASRDKQKSSPTFRIQDYQWDDQGYSLCNLFYSDISQFLDEKFKVGYNLTYYTLGPKTNIDTSPFRRAIWNYIQCIYGMRHDDYNYREVNILLERNLKCFIKNLACYPERVPKQDFADVMQGFRPSEKIHVIIMVSEARLQTELLYALRTITEVMKTSS
ncbi:PREDICTED: sestrin homolog [Rhagoletis zephyria]|uniref:sestrin homolog n=1 Tax=Rhagoletis zephyria TaxID=28612 RepID=UPI00081167E7|nr:PREDICTED: sestrin homolog [Rhagoletis zephyria]